MLALIMFTLGMTLAVYGAMKVEQHDIAADIRQDWYGSNISYVWPYSSIAQLGFALAVVSPFVALVLET